MTLREFFTKYDNVGIALSGGVDSIYLMYVSHLCGANVRAYFAKNRLSPESELSDAVRAAEKLGVPLSVLEYSALDDENVTKNASDRCYFCKLGMMRIITEAARNDGCEILCEGTNASDDVATRPGFRALGELSVLSPLRMCGLTKEKIRALAYDAGLDVWDKPSYSCLATRIKTGERITEEKILRVASGEERLFSLGFSDFRIRLCGDAARLELSVRDTQKFRENEKQVLQELKKYFECVFVELEARG